MKDRKRCPHHNAQQNTKTFSEEGSGVHRMKFVIKHMECLDCGTLFSIAIPMKGEEK
jgi:hypothetical protein